jgi:hypothetical protein
MIACCTSYCSRQEFLSYCEDSETLNLIAVVFISELKASINRISALYRASDIYVVIYYRSGKTSSVCCEAKSFYAPGTKVPDFTLSISSADGDIFVVRLSLVC